jgi:hypothetical protein
MLVDPLSSGSRRLKGGGSQDWLPHSFDPVCFGHVERLDDGAAVWALD